MSKEAIELLEKAREMLVGGSAVGYSHQRLYEWIDQALTLLKPPECALCGDKKVVTRLFYEKVPCPDCAEDPKCKTCGDTGKVSKPMPTEPHPCNYVNLKRAERTISCPDCQPAVGEPECKTCGDTGIKYCTPKGGNTIVAKGFNIPCPDCQPKVREP